MAISEDTRKRLYRRSGGQCECTIHGCKHHQERKRCTNFLFSDAWKAVRIRLRGSDSLRNLRAVCPTCGARMEPT
jgi:hypothetical protein